MKKIYFILIIVLVSCSKETDTAKPLIKSAMIQSAPITTAATVRHTSVPWVTVPVTVKDFTNISAVSLTLQFNPDVLQYLDGESVSGYWLQFNSNTPNRVTIGGCGLMSLPDNTVLFTLKFRYMGGVSDLVWITDDGLCEYGDTSFEPLPDNPKAEYYINGRIY